MSAAGAVTLVPIRAYRVRIGDKDLGLFFVDSTWNGMVDLTSRPPGVVMHDPKRPQKLVVDAPDPMLEVFDLTGQGQECEVVRASPDLALEVKRAQDAAAVAGLRTGTNATGDHA